MDRDKLISMLHQIKALADECLADLGDSAKPRRAPKKLPVPSRTQVPHLSFTLNPRAFMKRYGRALAGAQKFTVLLARLANGKTSHEVALEDIEKHWNSMTSLMDGEFNRAHTNRAKENGWVDSPKRGVYVLTTEWKEMFKG